MSGTYAEGLRVSGFGTLGYVTDNRPEIAPVRDIAQLPGDSFRTGASWKVDSRLGLQLEYALTPGLDVVGQWVARDQFHGSVGSATDLAYVAGSPLADVQLRAGRVNFDAFLFSDHRNVGYAYAWVRPPQEFYGWIPVFSVDGGDASYTRHDEEGDWRFKWQAGTARQSIPIGRGYDFRARGLSVLSVTRHDDHWRAKLAYTRFSISNEVPAFAPLHDGLDQLAAAGIPAVSAEAADFRRQLTFRGTRISYLTLGGAYDDGVWFAQGELGRTTATADVVPHGSMAYVSLGRRFGEWAPFVLRSVSRPGNAARSATVSWGAADATLRDPALFTMNSTRIEQDTWSFGGRWDFHRSAAFKLQWDRTLVRPSGYGLWWRDTAINNQQRRIDVLTATLDFVF